MTEFEKYAIRHKGISSMSLHRYQSLYSTPQGSITPYIIEERQLNVAQMDVFSRLMMDRILFLGVPILDEVANIIQAQLLFLDSSDPGKDIQIYINSPGGSVTAGLGIYDTVQLVKSDVATICTGQAASMAAVLLAAGEKGKRSALPHARVMIHQPVGGVEGQAGYGNSRQRDPGTSETTLSDTCSTYGQNTGTDPKRCRQGFLDAFYRCCGLRDY